MSKNQTQVIFLSERIAEHGITYATPGSAAFDLRANIEEELVIQPGECHLIGTGLQVWLDNTQLAGLILPRSGLGHKHGIILGNGTGLVDSDYQGELKVSCWNRSNVAYTLSPYERFAQYAVVPVVQITPVVVDAWEASERGEGGFGSSGKN